MTAEATPLIEIHALNKIYRDFWRRPTVHAVRGIDLTLARGEVFGLLGPNGSGKSTTIKLILGLLRPSSGTLRVFGRAPDDVATKARIGYLPEVSHLHRFLTPWETLHYYAALFGLGGAEARRRVTALLEMVGLMREAHRPVGEFSKGMARRVGLAQALVNNPDLIILDEPTSGLDPIACREVKDLLRTLAAAGKTILMTSHLLADVEDVCDRIAILCAGSIRACGRVDALLLRPDAVRLTLEGMSDEAAAALRRELEARTGRPVGSDHPRVDLESFFLQVVAEAGSTPDDAHFRAAPFLASPPVEGGAAAS